MRVLHVASHDKSLPIFGLTMMMKHDDFKKVALGLDDKIHLVDAAEVKTSSPDDAFFLTNTIESAWHTANPSKVTATGKSLRSTSAGDILVTDNDVLLIDMRGFKTLGITPDQVKMK